MKIRHGFVSNSSSSSYLIHYYFQYEKPKKDDQELVHQYFGTDTELQLHSDQWKKYKTYLPIDIPSVASEIRKILKQSKKVSQNHIEIKRYLIHTYYDIRNRQNKIKKDLDLWQRNINIGNKVSKDIIKYRDKWAFWYGLSLASFPAFCEILLKQINFKNLRYIEFKSEISDNYHCGRHTIRDSLPDGFQIINSSSISYEDLLKEKKELKQCWTVWSNQTCEDKEIKWDTKYIREKYTIMNEALSLDAVEITEAKMDCIDEINDNRKQFKRSKKSLKTAKKKRKKLKKYKKQLYRKNPTIINNPHWILDEDDDEDEGDLF